MMSLTKNMQPPTKKNFFHCKLQDLPSLRHNIFYLIRAFQNKLEIFNHDIQSKVNSKAFITLI